MTNGLDRFYALFGAFQDSVQAHYAHRDPKVVWNQARMGSIKLLDALVLRDELMAARPEKVLEIGSFLGFSTRWILEATADCDSAVTSLDPQVRHRIFNDVGRHVAAFCAPHGGRLTQKRAFLSRANYNLLLADTLRENHWQGDPVALLDGLKAIEVVTEPFERFDFAFVDGDHSFPATVANVALVAAMLPEGGRIVVHDAISWPDVVPALEALETASQGQIVLEGIAGLSYREVMQPLYATRMTSQNAAFSCNAVNDGLGLVRVAAPVRDVPGLVRAAMALR